MRRRVRLTHSAREIVTGYLDSRELGASDFEFEISDDHYAIHLVLCWTKLRVTRDSRVLHDGLIFPGMMRMASPGEKAEVRLFAPTKSLIVQVPGFFVRESLQALPGVPRPNVFSQIDPLLRPLPEVAQLGKMLVQAQRFNMAHRSLFLRGITGTLLAYLLRNHGGTSGKKSPVDRLSDELCQRALEYADSNHEKPLTLKSWAIEAGMPVDDFRRRFRATVGISPYAWYMERRIEKAKDLMVNSKESLSEIAFSLGFSSQSHFTEIFRRCEGVSPARWREKPLKLPGSL
jgi:AraC family transcriptional regulator